MGEYTIKHNIKNHRASIEKDHDTAYVEYELINGTLNILHTYVPIALEGQGIASQLVRYIYDYAIEKELTVTATCSYAQIWLQKHS